MKMILGHQNFIQILKFKFIFVQPFSKKNAVETKFPSLLLAGREFTTFIYTGWASSAQAHATTTRTIRSAPNRQIGSHPSTPNPIQYIHPGGPNAVKKKREKRKKSPNFPIRCPAIRGARLPRSIEASASPDRGRRQNTPIKPPLKTQQTVAARRFEPAGGAAGAFSPRGGGAGRNPSDGGVRGRGGSVGAPRGGPRRG